MMNREPIYITDPIKGLVLAGHTTKDEFIKEANKDDHFFRVHNGYAIQAEVFEILRSKGINSIVVKLKKKTYLSNIDQWRSIPACGHGRQRALSIKEMTEKTLNG